MTTALRGRLHLWHRWVERNTGKDHRWQECRCCGKRRALAPLASNAYLSGPPGL